MLSFVYIFGVYKQKRRPRCVGLLRQACAAPPRRVLGRTPSSPSVLWSRMRELIREKVVETTVDRSDLAAVERERRQRAADAFIESLRRHHHHHQQQQQQQQHRHSSGSVDVTPPPAPQASRHNYLRQSHVARQVAAPYSVWQRFFLCRIESNVNENFKVIQNPVFLPDHPQN